MPKIEGAKITKVTLNFPSDYKQRHFGLSRYVVLGLDNIKLSPPPIKQTPVDTSEV